MTLLNNVQSYLAWYYRHVVQNEVIHSACEISTGHSSASQQFLLEISPEAKVYALELKPSCWNVTTLDHELCMISRRHHIKHRSTTAVNSVTSESYSVRCDRGLSVIPSLTPQDFRHQSPGISCDIISVTGPFTPTLEKIMFQLSITHRNSIILIESMSRMQLERMRGTSWLKPELFFSWEKNSSSASDLTPKTRLDFGFCHASVRSGDALDSVGIVVPTRSQQDWSNLSASSLYTNLLPSLRDSLLKAERATLKLHVFVVHDSDDDFWVSDMNQLSLSHSFPYGQTTFVGVEKRRPHRIPHNEGCQAAYDWGADFIVRVNDDTEFLNEGWLSAGISTLRNFTPYCVGVVGPTCEQGNTEILTHDMVHRTHLDIFETYYPEEFDNWYLDDWISSVYGSTNTAKLLEWRVRHRTDRYGQRYVENRSQEALLFPALLRGKDRIIQFLSS